MVEIFVMKRSLEKKRIYDGCCRFRASREMVNNVQIEREAIPLAPSLQQNLIVIYSNFLLAYKE